MTNDSADELVSKAEDSLEKVDGAIFKRLDSTADELADELNEYHTDLFWHAGDWKSEKVVNAYDNAQIQLGHAHGGLDRVHERIQQIYFSLTEEGGVIEQAEEMERSLNHSLDLSKLPEDTDVDREHVESLIDQLNQQLDAIIDDELERMRLMAKQYKD